MRKLLLLSSAVIAFFTTQTAAQTAPSSCLWCISAGKQWNPDAKKCEDNAARKTAKDCVESLDVEGFDLAGL